MVSLVGIVLVLGGAVLLFAGAALSVYGVALLGVVLGGGVGFLFAPTIGDVLGVGGILAVVAGTVVGIVVGLLVTYALLSVAVAAVSFLVGTYVGFVAVAPLLTGGSGVLGYPVALAVGGAAALLGSIMTKTTMVLVTSVVGATLVSRSVTVADVAAAGADLSPDPLVFDLWSPLFLVLVVLGVLSQFGLFRFGYVTKLVALLPGASVFRDRDETPERQ
jgi:hypothetical protein